MNTVKPPTLEVLKAARAEHARVYRLNRPAFLANKAIRLRNWEREQGFRDDPREPWIDYVVVEEWALLAYQDEALWKDYLRARRPGVWRELILELPDEGVRGWVANIVWWDYFADRTMSERWPELDEWLNVPPDRLEEFETESGRQRLETGLLAVGYSEWEANRRAWGGKEDFFRAAVGTDGVKVRGSFGGKHHGRVGRRFEPGAGRGKVAEHAGGVMVGRREGVGV